MKHKLTPQIALRRATRALKKHSPTILTCIGAVGVVGTAVLAVKATPKAMLLIEEAKEAKNDENGQNLTRMDTIAACWTCYAPAAVTGIATIGCIFGANVLNRRQQAALSSAYALVNRSFMEYKNKVKELYGQEAHERIMQELMAEKTDPPCIYGALTGGSFDFGETDDAKHLFYDELSKRYFEARISDVLLAELHVNRNFAINGGEIGVEQFYEFLGLDTPEDLQGLCWFVSDYYYFIDFTHSKRYIDDGPDREQIECWAIEMPYPPTVEPLEEM